MTSFLNNLAPLPLRAIKQDISNEWFHCQFCPLMFSTQNEHKSHTFSHFNTRSCANCNVFLIQVCDEWFELHTASNCQNANPYAVPGAGAEVAIESGIVIKQEPQVEMEPNEVDGLLAIKTDVDLNDFGDIFAASLNTTFGIDETNSASHLTYRVVNVKEISKVQNDENHPAKSFKCRFCDKSLSSRLRLNAHLQSYHDVRSQTNCKHCNRTFSSFEQLDKHLRRCIFNNKKRDYVRVHPHRPAENFICDLCGRKLKKFRTLIDHMSEVHSSKYSFKCRICERLYPNRYYLSKHLKRHKQLFEGQPDGSTIGDLDDNLMERKKYVRYHPHRPQMNFICDICGKAISRYDCLEEHMSTVHCAADSFQCRICGRVYPNRYYLTKHLARHKNASENGTSETAEDLDVGLMERNKYIRLDPSQRESGLKCDECGRQFKHYYLLMEHKNAKHSGVNTFQCRKCGRFYPNRYYLTKHLKRHDDAERNGVPIDQLDEDFDKDLMERNRYVRSETNEQKSSYDCEMCGSTFKKFYLLTEHKRLKHSDEHGFPCRKCGRSYPNRYYLAKHMKRHDDSRDITEQSMDSFDSSDVVERKPYIQHHPHQPKSEFTCESCGMVYKRYDLLKEHMTSNHSSNDSFMCQQCNRVYPNRYYLQKHMKRHQNDKMKEINLDENLIERNQYFRVHPHRPASNFICDICKKVLSSYYSIREHMLSRHSNKIKVKHSCTKCDKKFVSKVRLKKHRDSKHSDKTPDEPKATTKHICSVCGRLFPDRSKMILHEKTHSGIMASCEICGKKFLHKHYLRKHFKSVHARERPLSCNVDGCKWTFAYPQCLKRHQARRHGMVTNRNACPICSKEFPESTYHLKRHLKAHANNTAKEYIPESKPNLLELAS